MRYLETPLYMRSADPSIVAEMKRILEAAVAGRRATLCLQILALKHADIFDRVTVKDLDNVVGLNRYWPNEALRVINMRRRLMNAGMNPALLTTAEIAGKRASLKQSLSNQLDGEAIRIAAERIDNALTGRMVETYVQVIKYADDLYGLSGRKIAELFNLPSGYESSAKQALNLAPYLYDAGLDAQELS